MNIWVWAVNEENWPVVKDRKVWGVDNKKKAENIKKGDNIAFYVAGTSYFQGVYEVAGDWHDPEIDWPDGRDNVLEVDLKEIQTGYAHLGKLRELEFIKSHPNLGLALKASSYGPSNSSKPISTKDRDLMIEELKKFPAEPSGQNAPAPHIDEDDFINETFEEHEGPVRYNIVRSLFKELLGPKKGPGELIENPYDQYTLGILKSIYSSIETKEEPEPSTDPAEKIPTSDQGRYRLQDLDIPMDDESEDQYLADADLNPMQGARSLGLSFLVKGPNPKIKICCTWGRYENIPGLPSALWKRKPNFYISEYFDITKKIQNPLIPEKDDSARKNISRSGVEIQIRTNPIPRKQDEWNVSVFLVNNTPFEGKQKPEHHVFQPQIRIRVHPESTLEYLGRNHLGMENPIEEDLMFWQRNSKGRGHLCGVLWKEVDPEATIENNQVSFSNFTWTDSGSKDFPKDAKKEFAPSDIRTDFIPSYTILQPDLSDYHQSFDADDLAEMWDAEKIHSTLGGIVTDYRSWIEKKRKQLENIKDLSEEMRKKATENLDECVKCAERIEGGIKFLVDDEKARTAFCFMNSVMADKRRWDNRGKNVKDQKLNWYEFQIAFILQSLVSVKPGKDDEKKTCDILWFPTGGGKTEAYLGLIVFTFAYRRLLDLNEFAVDGGVTVISRYTLRLLTIQQFNRSLGAVLAAELKRNSNWKPAAAKFSDAILQKKYSEGNLWGKNRFSLGVWIGDLTPNKFKIQDTRFKAILNAEGALLPQQKRRQNSDYNSEPAQVLACPACGTTLAIPSSTDLKSGEKTISLTWIIRTNKTLEDLKSINDQDFAGDQIVLVTDAHNISKKFQQINQKTNSDGTRYYSFKVNFRSSTGRPITDNMIDNWWWNHVKAALGFRDNDDPLQSTRASRPGYFFVYKEGENKPYDFAIHCPNPECEINNIDWFEQTTDKGIPPIGIPFVDSKNPQRSSYCPIPALTVDEQVYGRCPTVIIATVDKFARLPFEPRASSIFGNVAYCHKYEGYARGKISEDANNRSVVKPFLPPSLIIQDELHLIEGPLGSMVGLYEMAVDILSSNSKFSPKYIASTATTKEAKSQVGTIYRKNVRIFPPQAVFFGDNYFTLIKEDPTCLVEKPGRLYVGICAPKGSLIVPVKIWAALLNSVYRIKKNPQLYGLSSEFAKSGMKSFEEFVNRKTDWYWTLVAYFNALKELSIARSLYNADVLRDVRKGSSIQISSVRHSASNSKFEPSIHFIPVNVEVDCTVNSVIIYCRNREGEISIAVYDDNSGVPNNLIAKTRVEDYKKECKEDENEFILENPFSIKNGQKIWIALVNYSNKTRFQIGSGEIKGRGGTIPKMQEGLAVFPQKVEQTTETEFVIRTTLKTAVRDLDPTNSVELSSATNSLELPEIMERLQEFPNAIDCLFTTSMFGTGIDIDRLGLMTVMGQPKSTSSYIQSTGRVGRKCPGLVVTWLRATRVRDLNHYENFVGYHRAIHRYVEPVSASPFAEEAVKLCLGPVAVGVLRNASQILDKKVKEEWRNKDVGPMFMASHSEDDEIKALKQAFLEIFQSDTIATFRKLNIADAGEFIDRTIIKWKSTAQFLSRLRENMIYEEYTMILPAEKNVVLGTPQHKLAGKSTVYKNTRTSLRDVESTSTFGDSGWAPSR